MSFSNNGHLFAVANINIIQIYQTYTGENPPNFVFRGHSGKIKSIFWQDDDLGFYSAGSDGSVFEFRIEEKDGQPVQKY